MMEHRLQYGAGSAAAGAAHSHYYEHHHNPPQHRRHIDLAPDETRPLLSHHDDMPLRTTGSSGDPGSAAGISHPTQAKPTPEPSRRRASPHDGEENSFASSPSLPASVPSSSSGSKASSHKTLTTLAPHPQSSPEGGGAGEGGENRAEIDEADDKRRPNNIQITVDREQNCDRRRPEEADHSRLPAMSNQIIGKTVTPYLKEHIPGLYAPVAKSETLSTMAPNKDPNSKYCYRHDPDLKCRRAADETKMVMIQRSLENLPSADQQAITHVWSLFSAAPSKHRELMLQGIITQCCFPQLSTVSREVHEQLKIDLLTALPTEISFKILCYLDTVSLCKAAQVSRQWRQLAEDDVVWHRMCEQHIDRKCTKCGWGLPLLERKRLRDWTRQQQLAKSNAAASNGLRSSSPPTIPAPLSLRSPPVRSPTPPKREHSSISSADGDEGQPKRLCLERVGSSSSGSSDATESALTTATTTAATSSTTAVERKLRPFKDVYRDRFRIGYNWRHGKCAIKILKGHTNGVTCLQLLDNILATGSYDATIKIWNIETGEELRTLRGHTKGVRTLQFDDSKLISGSLDKTVKIWNWHTGELLSSLACHSDGVISVHFDDKLLASGSIDESIKIFNFESKKTFCLRGHTDWVNSVKIDTESRTLLSASDDFNVKLWDLDTHVCIRTFDSHTGHVQQVLPLPPDFEPDEELLRSGPAETAALLESAAAAAAAASASASTVESVAANSVSGPDCAQPPVSTTGVVVPSPLRHPDHPLLSSGSGSDPSSPSSSSTATDALLRAAYGPSFTSNPSRPLPSRYFLSGGLDSTIRLIDTATGRCLKAFFGHFEGIWGLAGDTLRAVTGANDGMVKVWDPTSGKCERTFTGHRGPVICISLSDSRMASGGEDGEVRLYSFQHEGDGEGVSEWGTPS